MTAEVVLREHIRCIAEAARVAETRHPSCGAFAWLRNALNSLPPDLRPPAIDLPPHPEDDRDDGRAELRRLQRETRDQQRRLDGIAERIHPCPAPDAAQGYDSCDHGVWPCPATEAAWLARGLDRTAELEKAALRWQRDALANNYEEDSDASG